MTVETLESLLDRATSAQDLDVTLLHEAAVALKDVYPDAPAHPEALDDATEGVLRLVDRCLPGWSIHLAGQATKPDGHWRAFLRESDSRDSDEDIGSGRAPTVSLALLIALLKLGAHKARR